MRLIIFIIIVVILCLYNQYEHNNMNEKDNDSYLEPDTKIFLDNLKKQGGKPIYELSPKEARNILVKLQSNSKGKLPVNIEDIIMPNNISARIIRPIDAKDEILPVIMYFHGGGWVLGDAETHDRLIRELSVKTHSAVVFVNYSRAPEAQFPIAINQAYSATKYIAEFGESMKLDTNKMVVVGDSAGGNIAIAVTMMAKRNNFPKIMNQVLFYPVTNTRDLTTKSYTQFYDGYWLSKKAMQWFIDSYIPDIQTRNNILASPLLASKKDLKNLPPALIICGENDVLRDEGIMYAKNLQDAGVSVELLIAEKAIHDFMMLDPLKNNKSTKDMLLFSTTYLRNMFWQ